MLSSAGHAVASPVISTDFEGAKRLRGSGEIPRNASLSHSDTRCSTQAASGTLLPTQLRLKANSRALIRATSRQALDLHSVVGLGKRASGIDIQVKFPESATGRVHRRDLSTPAQSLRFFLVGRDDRTLLLGYFSAPSSAVPFQNKLL